MSEYGFQSFPEFESVKNYTIQEDWDIYSDVMKSHQRHPIGNKNIQSYMKDWYNKPKDFQSFLYVSQLLQAKGMQIAIEAHRRNMPYCMGSLYWQINDCWPVASWSSIDYYGNWKASHFKTKELYKPIKTLFFEKDNQLEIHIVIDELKNRKAVLKLKVMNFKGELFKVFEKEIDIKLNSSHVYLSLDFDEIISRKNKSNTFIEAELVDEYEQVFDESIFFFETPKKLELTKPTFNYTLSRAANGKVVIELVSNVLAKDIRLSTTSQGKFLNNYFDMVPNKIYQIYFESEAEVEIEKIKENIEIMSLYDSY
jgi:beta-mannosidase